ncbi:unnamed protein product [Rotaria sp. Silwood1]|nr:unnamed protein product [Rotaria sp. Silwood1]
MDFEGLFSGDMDELRNMDTVSQVNPIEEDNITYVTKTGPVLAVNRGLPAKTTRLPRIMDGLNNENTNLNGQLAQMNNPALRNLLLTRINSIQFNIKRA